MVALCDITMFSMTARRMSEPAKPAGGGGLPVIVPEASHQTHLERVLSPPKPYSTRMPWLSERSLPTVDAAPRYAGAVLMFNVAKIAGHRAVYVVCVDDL